MSKRLTGAYVQVWAWVEDELEFCPDPKHETPCPIFDEDGNICGACEDDCLADHFRTLALLGLAREGEIEVDEGALVSISADNCREDED